MGSAPGIPGEGDLHRLVDGLLDAQRQGEVLLHLRGNAAEIAQVAAWREQNDLLKATFAGVEHEAVPASLRLTPLRLRCIGDAEAIAETMPAIPLALQTRSGSVRLMVGVGLCLAATALAGSWLTLSRPELKSASALFAGAQDTDDLVTASTIPDQPGQNRLSNSELPLAAIPDLGGIGFSFTDASLRPGSPDIMVFSYRDNGSGRLTLSVSRPTRRSSEQPDPLVWDRGGRRFELGGTGLDPDRLSVAASFVRAVRPATRPDN